MVIGNLLTLVSALALFLYGMSLLGRGLEAFPKEGLRRILGKMTDSSFKAVLAGAGVTGVIQSSSATTVLVVGLADCEIITLKQAMGIIMGANIGTTVTAWILDLTRTDFFVVSAQTWNFEIFFLIAASAGIFFYFMEKGRIRGNAGLILAGLAFLMSGMDGMSRAMEPLADMPGFRNLLLRFSAPVACVGVGAVLTALLQSSSASVGILQALSVTNAVSYRMAVPIIMGQNIGTCVTAILASVGAGKNAKRAAFLHLYFNVLGTVLFLSAFWVSDRLLPTCSARFLERAADGFGIAFLHSFFNIGATFLLLPFSGMLVRLVCLTVGSGEKTTVRL